MGAGVRQFLAYIEQERGCSSHTVAAYRIDLSQFEKVTGWSGEINSVASIPPETLEAFVEWLHHQGYRPTTIGRKIAAVRSLLKYACSCAETSSFKLLQSLEMPRMAPAAPKTLSRDGLGKLLQLTGADPRALRDYAILHLLAETGLRPSSIIRLEVGDIDWAHARLNLPTGSIDLHTSFAPLQAYVREGRPHLSRQQGVVALFLNRRGTAISRQGLWMIVKQRAKAAGLKGNITPQVLRHTFARHLLEHGHSYRDVQKRMRLSSANVLRIYHKDVYQ